MEKSMLHKLKNLPGRLEREIEKHNYKNNKYAGILQIRTFEESLDYITKNKISFSLIFNNSISLLASWASAF